MFKLNGIIVLIVSLFVTSCGDMFMKKNNDLKTISGVISATCTINSEIFAQILEKDISFEINCLHGKLKDFMKLVITDRPGFISQVTLKDFIKNGPIDGIDESDFDLIDAIFDLSYLILGGDRGYISAKGLDDLIDMLLVFNKHIWKVYKTFSSNDIVNYKRHTKDREVVYNGMSHISTKLQSIFVQYRSGEIDRIDTEVFLDKFFGTTPETFKKITSLMFLKKIFLGGQKYDLTFMEFEAAIYKLPELTQVALDVIKSQQFDFSDDLQKMISIYNKDVTLLKNNFNYGPEDNENLFNIYDIFTALETMLPEFSDSLMPRKYPREIVEIKRVLTQDPTGGREFASRELYDLLTHATNIFDEGEFIFNVYDHFKDQLNDPNIPRSIDFSTYVVRTERERIMLDNFSRIFSEYRYVKGSFKSPFFSHLYPRNPAGYMEIMALEYGVKLVMAAYGQENPQARGGYHMNLDETELLINKIKRFLRDNGITTVGKKGGGEATGTAENLVLMSTLFQNQSNGCSNDPGQICMEVPEITEFLVGLLTALSVKDFFIDEMQKVCGNEVDEYGRIYVDCFRKNFIKVLEEPMKGDGRSLSQYMPLLYSYIMELTQNVDVENPTDSVEYVKFLSETESFTRTCTHFDEETKKEPLPMKSTDAFAVFAGLLNVESTILRFDTNQNNKMDGDKNHNEVLSAFYEVYQGAVRSLVPVDGKIGDMLTKPIFQYLIKYGTVPDTSNFKSLWDFVKFVVKINKRADASRTTISTILKTLGEQSENAKAHPFKCAECLGNPDTVCVPEDGDWDYDWEKEEFLGN